MSRFSSLDSHDPMRGWLFEKIEGVAVVGRTAEERKRNTMQLWFAYQDKPISCVVLDKDGDVWTLRRDCDTVGVFIGTYGKSFSKSRLPSVP